jgi:ABC-type Fe3+-hydroxamate transport system substrate-binding protein
MVEKSTNNFNKKDLDLILEVNNKAIEIQTAVADQNEEILELLGKIKEKNDKSDEKIDKTSPKIEEMLGLIGKIKEKQDKCDEKLEKISSKTEEINKDIFKLQVLFVSGLLSLIIQIIQIFVKK